jgi:predicted PhzF superfamily epimerase YddE/YHI9
MVKSVCDELVSRVDIDETRRQDAPGVGAPEDETTGSACCALEILSGAQGLLLVFFKASAQHAA